MNDKPLHVRVAEALGCKPYLHDDHWYCDDPGGRCPAKARNPWQHDGYHGSISLFDTDWGATGPLIKKYKIWLTCDKGIWLARTDYWPEEAGLYGGRGDPFTAHPPLVAVCRLILALKDAGKL